MSAQGKFALANAALGGLCCNIPKPYQGDSNSCDLSFQVVPPLQGSSPAATSSLVSQEMWRACLDPVGVKGCSHG